MDHETVHSHILPDDHSNGYCCSDLYVFILDLGYQKDEGEDDQIIAP